MFPHAKRHADSIPAGKTNIINTCIPIIFDHTLTIRGQAPITELFLKYYKYEFCILIFLFDQKSH